jgi:crotonobetainyl-CoA:carnitine CoA-transferase CaiB-like acyl-CoA transferase
VINSHPMNGALTDILVIDLARVLAGPYATMLLGDFGARIIKVEQPGAGDDTRRWGPPFTTNGESAYFFSANRNKESITLNLKSEEGRAILKQLVARADVVVENFRVGMTERLGIDYPSLCETNPQIIYCSLTGYGQTGPYRDRPGYDTVIQAQAGLMSITGPADSEDGPGEPFKVGVAVVDVTAGLYAANAILAALHHRTRTGEGQSIDIALFDTQLSWLVNVASAYLVSGHPPKRYGNAHASIVPYQTMPTADGWLMLAVGNDGQFAALCAVLGCAELASDPRFATNPQRVAHRTTLIPLLEARFRIQSAAQWLEQLLAAGVPCGPVNDIPTALADPQTQARQMVQVVEHPQTGPVRLLGPAPKMSGTPATIRSAPPLLGEHTAAVLREFCGYEDEQIAELRKKGVI